MKSRIRQWLIGGRRFRTFQRARVGAFLVPTLVACSDTTGPTRIVSITPASQTVVLQSVPTGKVLHTSVTLTNDSRFPVTWGGTCGVSLEKKIDVVSLAATDGPTPPWFTVWSAICAAVTPEAVAIIYAPIQPGQSISIPIDVPVTLTGTPRFDGSPGEYRVHLSLATQLFSSQYRVIPHDLSVSDPFSVVAQ